MKTLKFNFCHPVKGIVRLFNKLNPELKRIVTLDTQSGLHADISIDSLPEGKWKATMEWEHDGQNFFYEKEFEIKPNKAGSNSLEEHMIDQQ